PQLNNSNYAADLDPKNFIKIHIANTAIWALIDTGAEISFINDSLITSIPALSKLRVQRANFGQICSADDHTMSSILGKIFPKANIAGKYTTL
ncbi:hypothetical protein, partial [Acinetobacter baumannii]|uniref:hypothetical protein n=1 Tax=Acinetobacter baumannii TaxID=470 RepID=UPI001C07E410